MKYIATTATAIALTTTSAFAGAIDRSGQFLDPLFQKGGETGQYVQLSFGQVDPRASSAVFDDPLQSFSSVALAYKAEFNDRFSFALILDEPFGANISVPIPGLPVPFEGIADIDSTSIAGIGRYKFNENWSVHGGLRLQKIAGRVQTVVGGTIPANLNLSSDFTPGLIAGVAYERPDIALRVALTYNSEIDNDLDGTEAVGLAALFGAPGGPVATTVTTPESINLEFQSGIAADTLVFGSIRHVFWDGVDLSTGVGEYVSFNEDTTAYRLGLGRRFNDNWSGAVTLTHERGDGLTTTLLAPTDGITAIGLAATYTGESGVQLTGGVTYGKLQDTTFTGTGTEFDDNDVVGAGFRVGFNF